MLIVHSTTVESGLRLTIGRSKAPQKSQQFYTALTLLWILALSMCNMTRASIVTGIYETLLLHIINCLSLLFKFKTVILMILEDMMD